MLVSKKNLTPELIKEYLSYNKETGQLTWIKKLSSKTVVGRRAGCHVKGRDNRIIKFMGEVYIEHRFIWFMQTGKWPEHDIDHINHNECDNSWNNLRHTTREENNCNMSFRKNNKSGVIGVYLDTSKSASKISPWVAEIRKGERRYIKHFQTKEQAALWRKEMEKQLGFHPNHGIKKPICA